VKTLPAWKMPPNLKAAVEDADGIWEDRRFEPITLSVMTGTIFDGREVPFAWQIEFCPDDEQLTAANSRLEGSGADPDGCGWGEAIRDAVAKNNRELASRLHLGDCETDTCVIWVESEEDCKKLLTITRNMIFQSPG
jgi:hypothetical protein